MDKSEYWLLDSVVESRYKLRWLVAKNVDELLNRRSHGLERDELVSVLDHLFQRGDLLAEEVDKSVTKRVFVPAQAEVEEAFHGRLDCFFGLTAQGGARWEEVSEPQWDRYITDGVYAEPQEGEIIGSDRDLVERYHSLSRYNSEIAVVPGSEHWDVLRPWQATYWKDLPVGHRLRYNYEWVERSPEEKIDPAISQWLKEVHHWYTPYRLD